MVSLAAKVDPAWAGQSLEFVFFRGAAQLGNNTAASETTVSDNPVFSATVNMASFGDGDVDIILRQDASPFALVWTDTITIDSAGDQTEVTNQIETQGTILDQIKAQTDLINSGTVNTNAPTGARIDVVRNDAYDGTANPAFTFEVTKDYTSGWTGTFTVRHRTLGTVLLSKAITITDPSTLTLSLSAADTAFSALTTDQEFGPHPFDIEMVSGSSSQTPYRGYAVVFKDRTTS